MMPHVGGYALTAGLALSPLAAMAESIRCEMDNDQTLTFDIDHTQFAAPQHAKEPPRQQRTHVAFGDKQFPATPFLLADVRGFEAEGLGGSTVLFVMQANGSALLSNAQQGTKLSGTCTVTETRQ